MVNQINHTNHITISTISTSFSERNRKDFGFARSNVFSQDLFEQLSRTTFFWKTTTKMVYFYCFLSKNRLTLCNVSPSTTRSTGSENGWTGGRLVDENFAFFIFSVDMVDMIDAKRMDPKLWSWQTLAYVN